MNPGRRLLSAASLCRGGNIIDIGSDHGFLPVWLLLNAKCESASASDINPMPLERCRKTAEKYGVAEKMRFFLSDGFDSVEGVYDAAFVCGMGGIMIADIIRRAPQRAALWVLQPMTNAAELRRFLVSSGYSILGEKLAEDDGKIYQIICAEYRGTVDSYTEAELLIGKSFDGKDGELFTKLAEKTVAELKKRKSGLEKSGRSADFEDAIIKDIEKTFGVDL